MKVAATDPKFRLMLDTHIISDLMRDPKGKSNQQLQQLIASEPKLQVCTSVVVDCEVRYGLRRRPSELLQKAYENVLLLVEILPLNAAVTNHYVHIRNELEKVGTPIGPNDTLIAARALSLGTTLVTADAEFRQVPGLKVENWLANT